MLTDTGHNPYFILEPGYQLRYLDPGPTRWSSRSSPDTELVDGVRTRVVEERESRDGTPVEVSRNYFAIRTRAPVTSTTSARTSTTTPAAGSSDHDGSWPLRRRRAPIRVDDAGRAAASGKRHYQEVAPGVALDRAEVLSNTESVQVPAGAFTGVSAVIRSPVRSSRW